MKILRVFALFLLLIQTGLVLGRDSTGLDQAVDKIVIQLKGGDEHAAEYRAARRYHTIELGNPGTKYIASIFTIESFNGGNNYHFYLALLKQQGEQFQKVDAIEIGSGGYRHVNFEQVSTRDDKIVISTLEYVRDSEHFDANCCPSRKSEATFELVSGKLREIAGTAPAPESVVFIPGSFSPSIPGSGCGIYIRSAA